MKATNFKVILIMGLLTAIAPLSIDMYLPAFPSIARGLQTSISEVTLSLSSFFIGISAGQLLYGPFLDRFGTYFILPESKKPDPNVILKPVPILRNFATVLKHPHFLTYALTGAISYAGLYAYVGGAPYVFMELFKVSEAHFGWIFAFIAAGLISASQLNNIALKHYSSQQIIRVASSCQSLIGLMFICFTVAGWLNLPFAIAFSFLFLACQGFIFPNATALALAPLGNHAGNASGLIGAIQMTVGASASAIISVFQNHSALPMASVMTFCAVAAYTAFSFGRKFLIKDVEQDLLRSQDIEMVAEF